MPFVCTGRTTGIGIRRDVGNGQVFHANDAVVIADRCEGDGMPCDNHGVQQCITEHDWGRTLAKTVKNEPDAEPWSQAYTKDHHSTLQSAYLVLRCCFCYSQSIQTVIAAPDQRICLGPGAQGTVSKQHSLRRRLLILLEVPLASPAASHLHIQQCTPWRRM